MAEVGQLARYVPEIALEWFETEPDRRYRIVDGSLCFADISGFTALSERLAARGRNGAEELVEVLSEVFGTMVDIARSRGGQLLKFGGDAQLFLFDGPDHTRQACAAAVEMRQALRRAVDIPTAVGRLRLSMSVGVGSGDIHFFLVGSSHRELVVAGPVVTATLEAEHAARAGEVKVSPATAMRLPASAVAATDDGPALLRWRVASEPAGVPPSPAQFDPETARALLPDALCRGLFTLPDPGHRIATMAFIRFSGLDRLIARDLEMATDALDRTVSAVQDALVAEGVTLLHVDVDVDGGKFFCSSGLPMSSEDNEGRMLRALLAIANTSVPLTLQLGTNRGHVFAASVGRSTSAAYSGIGDTTNTAARITAKAPAGVVYAHPSVLEHARRLYSTQLAGPFLFKGKSEPMVVYEVAEEVGLRSHSVDRRLPFHGRASELSRLRDAVAGAANGHGAVVTVSGPTGFGKSRLRDEAVLQQELAPLLVLRAEPSGVANPYRPFREPVRAILGVERASNEAMAAAFMAGLERLDPALVPLGVLLAPVARVDVPETAASAAVSEANRPDRTADILIRVLELANPGPLAIVIDDAQWADAASSHLLGRIAAATATHPWLLAVFRRDTGLGYAPVEGDVIRLGPLDDGDIRSLVITAAAGTPLRSDELERIVKRAAGNPGYVEEMARAARLLGSLEQVPDSIHAVISAQIDALPTPTRRALALASVLGRSFRRVVLVEVLEREGLELDAAMEMELRAFLEPDGELRWRFINGLVREVAYEHMAFRTRARLHLAAGLTLERILAGNDVDADTLASHFAEAGDYQRTWTYSLLAADRAQGAAAHADAGLQLERALEAARRLESVTDRERLERWRQLGDVRDRAGLLDGAIDAYRRVGRLLGDDPVDRADLLLRRAKTHERSGSFSVALAEASRVRSLLDGLNGPEAATRRAEALAFSALVRQRQERAAEALRLAQLADSEARHAGALSAQARASNVVSWAATMLGRADATEWARRALSLYEEAGDLVGQADMANNLGIQAYFEGRWDETIVQYRRSREACERVGNVIDAALTDANIAEVLSNQRRFEEAEPLLRDASRVMRASGYRAGAAFADMHLARLLTASGQPEQAEPLLRVTIDELVSIRRTGSAYEASLYLADCLSHSGRPKEALQVLATAVALTSDDVSIYDAAKARFTAEALIRTGEVEEAAAALEVGIVVARARGLGYELALMLADASSLPVAVATGSDESPYEESRRLLRQLGVVLPDDAPSDHRQNGSPEPS